MSQTHHLHLDPGPDGGNVITCLRCQFTSTDGTFPPEPCPHADVEVLCDAEETSIVITINGDDPAVLDHFDRRCRMCGCTDDRACPGGCWWTEADLCSSCRPVAVVQPS